MTERHDDLRPRGALSEERPETPAEHRGRIFQQRRQAFRVEKDHARPGDRLPTSVGRLQAHRKKVPFVIERVLTVLEVWKDLFADRLQEFEMLLSALECLLHRDDTIAEHACLWHGCYLFQVGSR
jgi:hypothetical protein